MTRVMWSVDCLSLPGTPHCDCDPTFSPLTEPQSPGLALRFFDSVPTVWKNLGCSDGLGIGEMEGSATWHVWCGASIV